MISDEPDEDADTLEDEDLLEHYFAPDARKSTAGETPDGSGHAAREPDWPRPHSCNPGVHIDPETVAWFKANHTDWQLAMAAVLRAWINTRPQPIPDTSLPRN